MKTVVIVCVVNSKISYSEELARCRQRLTCKRKEMSEMESCLNEDCCASSSSNSNVRYICSQPND